MGIHGGNHFFVFVHTFFWILDRHQFVSAPQLNGSLQPHSSELARRPGNCKERRVKATPRHSLGSEAIALAQDDSKDRHRDVGTNHIKAAAVTHQCSFFRNGAHHVTRRITEKDEGDVIGIAKLHKARRLIGGIAINGASQMVRVVSNNAHRSPFDAGQGSYHAQAKASTQLQDRIRIAHGMDHLANVVDTQSVFRNDLAQKPLIGTLPFLDQALEIAEILLSGFDRFLLVLDGNIHNAIWHLDRHGSYFFGTKHTEATTFDHGWATHANGGIFRRDDHVAAP